MHTFQKILFPVDFSEVSPKIVPWVSSVAKQYGAEIYLLFVARTLIYYTGMYVEEVSIQNMENDIITGAERNIEEFANAHFGGQFSWKTRVIQGDAAEEIIKYIQSEGIDLVIMGTHGRKGLNRILFGSVADRVIKMSPVPVLSVNPYRVSEIEFP